MTIQIVPGFSPTNRILLYASLALSPAQFVSGLGNNCPSNLGFLAYNLYTQVQWYQAMTGSSDDIHALSLILPHFNFLYMLSYLGGVSSGNVAMGALLGLGTAAVIVLNTVSAWTAWAVYQPQGYGVYQFFFFGWRTLDEGWHKWLFMLWQVSDSGLALAGMVAAIVIVVWLAVKEHVGDGFAKRVKWWYTYAAVPAGGLVMLFVGWPLILWTELIISRNELESETDMVAVWLFVAQAVTMLLPSCGLSLSCFRCGLGRQKSSSVV
ncbi:hypothetical protein NEUTE1DRAFT_83238 [Neurospora tetrasperma FGSC 2508]|uniref:Uncharacterized protein n=1 Tax=Neurospora tetrasperma (strain FGSC 2508 / ATCC MYA-4615 / P0657) TaxID=510951 RepID=F8MNR5_NEUT8|nr:uncharacterized protein NEUTE1DRAFT_83238 [Neurospora tetrasperma FGSC 2508]EGO56187.1 hypothetical protein NEUTE1DRAFT_83238 [Neurospora tetrasperma FGSC 2508]EGZ70958.1 hypothetical protein NEUTE2DRAFT_92808 [Neurospora tetrasperma FGSC 2509]